LQESTLQVSTHTVVESATTAGVSSTFGVPHAANITAVIDKRINFFIVFVLFLFHITCYSQAIYKSLKSNFQSIYTVLQSPKRQVQINPEAVDFHASIIKKQNYFSGSNKVPIFAL
jgi:hypothetical protein